MSERLSDYDFELPESLIAQTPMEPRDHSRLLVLDRASGAVAHQRFDSITNLLGPNDVLVANNTRVIPARLLGRRVLPDGAMGGAVEFVLLERLEGNRWEGLFKASVRSAPGVKFLIPTPDGRGVTGTMTRGSAASAAGTVEAEFDRDPVSAGAGELPLPPYIEARDAHAAENYQTVYSKEEGSAAAPTAGLHFTDRVLARLRDKGVGWEEVTLHVGLGTFRPVKVDDLSEHIMHEERYSMSAEVADRLTRAVRAGKRIVAVGTTSVRTLESAWDAQARAFRAGAGRTALFIRPGHFEFKVVGGLVTNFHLPRSTLLMLVSAFAGRGHVLHAYAEAVREKYRFFSYGDAMLIR